MSRMQWDKLVLVLVTVGIAAVAVPFRAAAQVGGAARTRARVVSDVEGLTFTLLNNLPIRPGSGKLEGRLKCRKREFG